MTKITITRSQVAQLYVELTSDNLKETFIVEGDAVAEPEAAEATPEATPASEEVQTPEVPADAEPNAEATPAPAE